MNSKRLKKKLKRFILSYQPLVIILVILLAVVLIHTNNIIKSIKTYTFSGTGEYVEINNGVISLNYDMNYLNGSDIDYIKEKDLTVVDYKIGYYVKDGDNLISIGVIEDQNEDGFSLKNILEGKETFNIMELNSNNFHFTKERIDLLKNGLYFVIEAKDKKGNDINDVVKLDIRKITK